MVIGVDNNDISLAKWWSDTNPNKRLNEPFTCETMSRLVTLCPQATTQCLHSVLKL